MSSAKLSRESESSSGGACHLRRGWLGSLRASWRTTGSAPAGRPAIRRGNPKPPCPAEIEHSTMLFQLVGRLPEAQFRVIHMRFVEQKSIREIAQELGRSEGAVKQLQLRAIESLRAQMEGAHA